ncbi:choice-of-anchor M domain-containing protein [Microbacterium sp. gxy059]|uniref:choice-of-anchor M domain-containing protein n=1 Tax=Microbacterium sp. gxy059 TaxID=2957199 RepID=UPI003D966ED6
MRRTPTPICSSSRSSFLQNRNFDPPSLLWDSADPEPQDIWAEANTHVHANWALTEPGVYGVDVELTAELASGETASDRDVLQIAVGDETDPQTAFGAFAVPDAGAAGDEEIGAAGSEASEGAASDPIPTGVLVAGGAAVVVIAGAVWAVLRSRRARRLADEPAPREGDDA